MSQHFRQIDHPLRRGGLSRPERDVAALDVATAPLDGRGLGELLRFWYDYARQVNFFEADGAGVQVTGDWLDFFRRGIPFQYATIGAMDLDALDRRFQNIYESIADRRSFSALNPLLNLLLEMAGQLAMWKGDLREDEAGLRDIVQGLIDTSLREPVVTLLGLANGAAKWGYRPGIRLTNMGAAYGLSPLATFKVNQTISGRRGSLKLKVLAGRDDLENIYRLLWKAMEATVSAARDDARLEHSLRQPLSADTPPSLGLVYAFLLLFRDSQAHLNGLSGKHLDFFYRKTLRIEALPPVEDRAHLVFELGKRVEESLLLKKGLRFKAGKDEAGTEILFELPEDLVLTKTQVADLKTFYADPEGVANGNLYASPSANSGDGLGGKFPKGVPPAWPTVGAASPVYPDPALEVGTDPDMRFPSADLSFVLASPVLLLREGTRRLTVTLVLGESRGQVLSILEINELKNLPVFLPALTTEEGWMEVANSNLEVELVYIAGALLQVTYTITLGPEFPAVFHPGEEVFPLAIPSQFPAIKFTYHPALAARRDRYCQLGQLPVVSANIDVSVCGLRQLRLENDLSLLDPAKPFAPFGPLPKKNSSNFYIGSEEVFVKQWTELAVRLTWLDLPNFTGYYDSYPSSFVAGEVKAELSIRNNYQWTLGESPDKPLISGEDEGLEACPSKSDGEFILSVNNPEVGGFAPCTWPLNFGENISSQAGCGVMRLRLGGQDFLHDKFQQAIINVAGKNEAITERNADLEDGEDPEELLVANPPYTPMLASVTIDYEASDQLQPEGKVHFGHLHPWEQTYEWFVGADAGAGEGDGAGFPVLPTFPYEGHLYLGLSDYTPGELLHLYFELDAPTADPTLEKATVNWAYLRGNNWIDFENETQVIDDTTGGLIRSGIVQIAVPSTISKAGTTILPPAFHWIRAGVPERSAAIAATLFVSTQAAEVITVLDETNDAGRLADSLPGGSIAKVAEPVGDLKGIEQAYPTFGGRAPEDPDHFNRRVSELLRHKGRAITLHDYESIILQDFRRVYRAKCLTHTLGVRGKAEDDVELAPGHVTLVVVPDVRLVSAANPFEPRLPAAELERIRMHLLDKVAPCADLSVLNPEYESVRLTLCVRFHAGKSPAFYRKQLQLDLRSLLAPWTRPDAGADISFGGEFSYSTAVQYVEELAYVDFVRDLRILDPVDGKPVTTQAALHARSVLTTVNGTAAADQHQIIVLED